MYIYTHTCKCTFTYIQYVHKYIHMYIHIYNVYRYIHIIQCMYTCTYIHAILYIHVLYIHTCTYIHIYTLYILHTYIYMYIHFTYIYTYIHQYMCAHKHLHIHICIMAQFFDMVFQLTHFLVIFMSSFLFIFFVYVCTKTLTSTELPKCLKCNSSVQRGKHTHSQATRLETQQLYMNNSRVTRQLYL